MKIITRHAPPPMHSALSVKISGDELTGIILAYLATHNISLIGPLRIIVDDDLLHGHTRIEIQLESAGELIITE